MMHRPDTRRCLRHIEQPPGSPAVTKCSACLEAFERAIARDLAKVVNAEVAPRILDEVVLTLAELHARER